MNFIDYYKILGLNKSATPKEIKNAYRKLARKYHPDLHPDDRDAKHNFQQVNEANAVLSDPENRKKYDQYGENWDHAEVFEKSDYYQDQSSYYKGKRYSQTKSNGDFSDFFESLFGSANASSRNHQEQYKGDDYNAELHLGFLDAYKSHKQTLTVNNKQIRFTIPAGIENGQTIKISGHGGPGIYGGPGGDLYITFSIANHPKIKRAGSNLFTTVELDIYKAVLGGEITIDTLSGKVKLKVKPETQNGSKVKLKGKGFPVYKEEGKFGDLIITYVIKTPTNLSTRQRLLFTELSELQL